MADPNVVTILAFFHIVSAIGWLGGAVLFVSVIAPGLRNISPPASLEFLAKIGPKSTRFFIGASTATVIFGLVLYFYSGVDNIAIRVGAILGIVAYLDAMLFTVPAFNKADKMAAQMLASPQSGPPPAEFTTALKRGGMGVTTVVIILTTAAIFMVVSGFAY